ncbi:MAG: DUF2190 family protein [Arenicellales bacterium]
MSEQSFALFTETLLASGAVITNRFVGYDGAQVGAAANTLGVSKTDAADTEPYPVDVIGTTIVEAGAAIALGAKLETDASGRAITQAAGPVVGRALQAASAAGEKIEVLLIQQ